MPPRRTRTGTNRGEAQLRNAKRAHGEELSIDDYVLVQPPVYTGPPKPRNPVKPEVPPRPVYVPVVADFLPAAEREFKFAPQLPQSDDQFKRAYARVALTAGLTRDQIVRIYSFEATGNGSYDVEAGREYNKHARAITTALGYNQLLATNSVEIVAEDGNRFLTDLQARVAQLPDNDKWALANKIDAMRRMIAFARSVPDAWGQHEILANTEKGSPCTRLISISTSGPCCRRKSFWTRSCSRTARGLSGR